MHIQNNACASDPRQEPGAVVPLAGICAGGGPQGPFLPRTPHEHRMWHRAEAQGLGDDEFLHLRALALLGG